MHPRPFVLTPLRLSALTLVMIASLLAPSTALDAQAPEAPAGAAATSAVAVPFVGSYPVWCTDGNPAPGSLCKSHHGSPAIDVGMDAGVPIRSAGAGVVVEVESGCGVSWCRGGAGNFVTIGHADGTSSRYLHLSETVVTEDDLVEPGQILGHSGKTGQSTKAHLHYDEHFPAGSRTPFGPWLACVGGSVVQYPDILGYARWNDVPFGSLITNEGYECLDGVGLGAPAPIVHAGADVFGVAVPTAAIGSEIELELSKIVGSAETIAVTPLTRGRLARFRADDGAHYRVRIRSLTGNVWSDWSDVVEHDPTEVIASDTCWGFYASGTEGTPGVDVLIGGPDGDALDGGAGDDLICGGDGADTLRGGPGNDLIDGGAGDDTITGDDGNDRLLGRMGSDDIDGGAGRDRVVGGSGIDVLTGGSGPDVVLGGSAADTLRGSGGNDRLVGGRGDDEIFGGAGSDRLFGSVGVDSLDGGNGVDLCSDDDPALEHRKCES